MAQRVNIGGVKDDHYRYTMERLMLKVEGSGNGIKTVLVNVENVARDLKVPPLYPTKFFGFELGAQTTFDKKNNKYILNGKFDNSILDPLLDQFVKKFVLCQKCKLPETDMTLDKSGTIHFNCKACGHHGTADPRERLCKFIETHPPPPPQKMRGAAEQAKKTAAPSVPAISRNIEVDDEWSEDVSEEAVKRRLQEESLASKLVQINIDSDDEKKEEEDELPSPVEVLKHLISSKPDASAETLLKGIQKIKEKYELGDKDTVCLLFEALITKNIMTEIPKYAPLFKAFAKKSTTAQKMILSYLEDFVGKTEPSLLAKLPKILELLYDKDVVSEKAFISWHESKKSKFLDDAAILKKVKDTAKPFIEWLQEAEEDDD